MPVIVGGVDQPGLAWFPGDPLPRRCCRTCAPCSPVPRTGTLTRPSGGRSRSAAVPSRTSASCPSSTARRTTREQLPDRGQGGLSPWVATDRTSTSRKSGTPHLSEAPSGNTNRTTDPRTAPARCRRCAGHRHGMLAERRAACRRTGSPPTRSEHGRGKHGQRFTPSRVPPPVMAQPSPTGDACCRLMTS